MTLSRRKDCIKYNDIGVHSVTEIVQIIKENIQEKTEKFNNFLIQEIEQISRPSQTETDNKAVPLEGISKFHTIWTNKHGEIKGSVLTCTTTSALRYRGRN